MHAPNKAGFTLTEIMIVVMIVGLLAALALPGFAKARTLSANTRFVSDLRTASQAFDTYAQFQGDYPSDGLPAQMPVGMADYLAKVRWTQDTPIGGQWDWDFGQMQFGGRAGVSVYHPARNDAEMVIIDAMIDDGDLERGMFRRRSGGYIYFCQI